VYVKKFDGDDYIILLFFIDDISIVGRDKSPIEKLKKDLNKSFDINDLGTAKQIL